MFAAVNTVLGCPSLSPSTLNHLKNLKLELQEEVAALRLHSKETASDLEIDSAIIPQVRDVDIRIERLTEAAISIKAISRSPYISESTLGQLRSLLLDIDRELMDAISCGRNWKPEWLKFVTATSKSNLD